MKSKSVKPQNLNTNIKTAYLFCCTETRDAKKERKINDFLKSSAQQQQELYRSLSSSRVYILYRVKSRLYPELVTVSVYFLFLV